MLEKERSLVEARVTGEQVQNINPCSRRRLESGLLLYMRNPNIDGSCSVCPGVWKCHEIAVSSSSLMSRRCSTTSLLANVQDGRSS